MQFSKREEERDNHTSHPKAEKNNVAVHNTDRGKVRARHSCLSFSLDQCFSIFPLLLFMIYDEQRKEGREEEAEESAVEEEKHSPKQVASRQDMSVRTREIHLNDW
jgi:hypothetical protein